MESNLVSIFGLGLFLLAWETLDLMCFSLTNSFWTTCMFMGFGSSLLITGTLALASREKMSGGPALTWKQFLKTTLHSPSPNALFCVVNALSGTAALLLTIACLNSSTSLYFQKRMHGKSVVSFPIGTVGNPQSIIVKGTSIIDFYNAKASTQGVIEYTHSNKKYCAMPIVALTYRKQDQSKYWARCQISRKESCQDIRSSNCADIVDAPVYSGQRVSEKEETAFNKQLDGGEDKGHNILVDAHNPELTLSGLWYYALNLLWAVPTAITLVYGNKCKSALNKE